MIAIVLGAGKGERIATLSRAKPKPLLEIRGNPVLVHNLLLLASHGMRKVWINLHTGAGAIRRCVGNGKKWGVNVRYARETTLLGTAGGVKNIARKLPGQPMVVICGDNFTNCDLTALVREHRMGKHAATVAVYDYRKTNQHSGIAGGRVRMARNKRIIEFVEGNMKQLRWVNAGVYVLEPAFIEHIPDGFADFGRDVFPSAIERGAPVYAYPMRGFCYGMDTPESYRRALARSANIQ